MTIVDFKTVQAWVELALVKLNKLETEVATLNGKFTAGSVSTDPIQNLPEALLRLEEIQQRTIKLKRMRDYLQASDNVLIGRIRRLAVDLT